MGATDGYTTETTERLHKYYVKNPYRQTSKAQNTTEQMLVRFQREEAWDIARARLERAGKIPKLRLRERVGDIGDFGDDDITVEGEYQFAVERIVEEIRPRHSLQLDVRIKESLIIQPTPCLDISKRPTMGGLRLDQVAATHQAPGLWAGLQDYVNTIDPDLNVQLSETMKIGIWSFCKLIHDPLPFAPLVGSLTDFVRATQAKLNASGRKTHESNYDTVLIETYPTRKGIYKYRVGRVQAIFQLPHYAQRVIRAGAGAGAGDGDDVNTITDGERARGTFGMGSGCEVEGPGFGSNVCGVSSSEGCLRDSLETHLFTRVSSLWADRLTVTRYLVIHGSRALECVGSSTTSDVWTQPEHIDVSRMGGGKGERLTRHSSTFPMTQPRDPNFSASAGSQDNTRIPRTRLGAARRYEGYGCYNGLRSIGINPEPMDITPGGPGTATPVAPGSATPVTRPGSPVHATTPPLPGSPVIRPDSPST
ncbi:hypothetical protein RSOLAG22IIIB_07539 [Rhizoctonia solani]|uniref:Uncharacterized protein n=1 Tax=Rhizoctonia solani TaxID=456999 RepID=A0A0K6FNK7_9AGAM|nr:hypothetical protein RSOLAG22IIIB_07539 [Rhizoctonia solani]